MDFREIGRTIVAYRKPIIQTTGLMATEGALITGVVAGITKLMGPQASPEGLVAAGVIGVTYGLAIGVGGLNWSKR